MTTNDNKLEAVVVAALVVTSVIAGFAIIPAGTTVAQEQETATEAESPQEEDETDEQEVVYDDYTIIADDGSDVTGDPDYTTDTDHRTAINQEENSVVGNYHAESSYAFVVSGGQIVATPEYDDPAAGSHITAEQDGTYEVITEYDMEGTAVQQRESSAFRNGVNRAGAEVELVVIDETTGEVVKKVDESPYDTVSPSWDVYFNNAIYNTGVAVVDYLTDVFFADVLGLEDQAPFLDMLVNDEVLFEKATGQVKKDSDIEESYTNDGEISTTFEAEEGHEYSVQHRVTVGSIVSALGGETRATIDTDAQFHRTTVKHTEAPPSAESTVSVDFDGEVADSMQTDETTTAEIQMEVPESGFAGGEITVRLSDSDVANIVDVSPGSEFEIESTSGTTGEQTVTIADLDDTVTEDDGTVTLAEVEIAADSGGTTDVEVDVEQMDDDNGNEIDTDTEAGVIEVISLPPVVGSDSPTDPDGDGQYEDVNGNERLDFNDVVVFFQNMDSDVVTSNVDKFDYNQNGRIDFDDVVTLFTEVTQ